MCIIGSNVPVCGYNIDLDYYITSLGCCQGSYRAALGPLHTTFEILFYHPINMP